MIRDGAFGRGRGASIAAARLITSRTRSIAVKARVARHRAKGAPLRAHVAASTPTAGKPLARMTAVQVKTTEAARYSSEDESGFTYCSDWIISRTGEAPTGLS
jgi:hypothetical protein